MFENSSGKNNQATATAYLIPLREGGTPLYEKTVRAANLYMNDLTVTTESKNTTRTYYTTLTRFTDWLYDYTRSTPTTVTASAEQNSKGGSNGGGKGGNGSNADGLEISSIMVLEWKRFLATAPSIKEGWGDGLGNNTIRHYMTIFRAFMEWAVRHEIFTVQPVNVRDLPPKKEAVHDIPTYEEITLLLSYKKPKNCRKDKAAKVKAMVAVFLLSGLRVSELTNLQMRDLDFEQQTITVRRGKGGKSRVVPFPNELAGGYVRKYINEYNAAHSDTPLCDDDDYVFFGKDKTKPMSRQNATQLVETYVRNLTGHEGITAHDLRHGAASMWDTMGVPLRTVQQALGHSDVKTTEHVYVSVLHKEKAAQDISKLVDEILRIEGAKYGVKYTPPTPTTPPAPTAEQNSDNAGESAV